MNIRGLDHGQEGPNQAKSSQPFMVPSDSTFKYILLGIRKSPPSISITFSLRICSLHKNLQISDGQILPPKSPCLTLGVSSFTSVFFFQDYFCLVFKTLIVLKFQRQVPNQGACTVPSYTHPCLSQLPGMPVDIGILWPIVVSPQYLFLTSHTLRCLFKQLSACEDTRHVRSLPILIQ